MPSAPAGWNDPPKEIFTSSVESLADKSSTNAIGSSAAKSNSTTAVTSSLSTAAVQLDGLVDRLNKFIERVGCKVDQINGAAMQKRVLQDSVKKLQPLLANQSQQQQHAPLIHAFLDSVDRQDTSAASTALANMMTTIYSHDSARNQWILGLKRMYELSTTV